MRPAREVGILGYGVYIPVYRIKGEDIAKVWKKSRDEVPVQEKSVPGPDEDSLTLAVEASKNAIKRAGVDPRLIGAVYVGSESHPYAVKPTATVVAEAIGASPDVIAVDLEFACRAGTTAMQSVVGLVASGMIECGLAVGTDTAQGRPGDELEYTASAGAAAFVLSPKSTETVAYVEGTYSYITDTPDFWRRDGACYPCHTFRFTGNPAYFHHTYCAAIGLMEELGLKPCDFDYAVFHQPNVKFPLKIGEMLGFSPEKVKAGLLSGVIGNTYAASTMIGLAAVLDVAKPGQRILVTSFGSGAGSDAFSIVVQGAIVKRRDLAPLVADYLARRKYVDYATYAKYRKKIKTK